MTKPLTIPRKEKIMFICEEVSLFEFSLFLQQYTLNNGFLPDVIEMTIDAYNHYDSILVHEQKGVKIFMGIKIKVNY